ncbi:hypothetical protein DYB32_008917 [Aphanomyces invadans]|uniref:Peptidase M11 gametolysin domain-containing protein n=1 Tax=Aphanomyces invadans TaxID=157072 RepID=A0A418AJV4_9STRA|nr:hypothetical protein DYB32_008917 [Aphanomyces invadans]
MKIFRTLLSVGATAVAAYETYSAKVLVDSNTFECEMIESIHIAHHHRRVEHPNAFVELKKKRQTPHTPLDLIRNQDVSGQEIVEIIGGSVQAVLGQLAKRCPSGALRRNLEASEEATDEVVIKKIVDSGDPKNRIDIVFMGDGYTASEESRFFNDIERLTNDMFTGDTFTQYLPLFNVWAVYVPSAESGIGVGGVPRNTAFGLYRPGTELRGIFTTKESYAREVCRATGELACDFPVLIANDDYYGGRGGEFVMMTRSPTTGNITLLHELGHNFGKVGEEYDGGYSYYGANSASSLQDVPWKHWLTNPSSIREEKAVLSYQNYMWHELKKGAYQVKFWSTGGFKRWVISLSVTGADTQDAITITLDGKPLEWKTQRTMDRSFSDIISSTEGFTAGDHVLEITGHGSFAGPVAKQLCSVTVLEYGDEDEFKMDDPEYIGMFPTWDINFTKTYRPDNEKCLMRNLTSSQFCNVCQENMWLQFMSRITFIDDIVIDGSDVTLKLIPLGQLRPKPIPNEKYTVQWFNYGQEVAAFRDKLSVDVSTVAGAAKFWSVKVTLATPMVRVDLNNVMTVERKFKVDECFTLITKPQC